MDKLSDISKKILKSNDIAIYCHTNPDGDSIGCMLALYLALKAKGKEVYAFCDCPLPKKFEFLPSANVFSFPDKRKHDLGVSVDCSSNDRLGQCLRSFYDCRYSIAIDHHASYSNFADMFYVEKEAASCSQIIYKLLKEIKVMNDDIATLLYAGIVTDSGCFAFNSVTPEVHQIVKELLEYKFDHADVVFNSYRVTSFDRFKLKARVIDHARFYDDNQIGLIIFSAKDFSETNTTQEDTEGIIQELINISNVKVAYALAEVDKERYKLSIRTKNGIDASEIASQYGGGGHKAAAGCRVNGILEDIIEKIVKIASDRIC